MDNSRIRVEFKGSYLKQDKVTFTPRNIINLYIAYELDTWSQDLNADFTLKDCLELLSLLQIQIQMNTLILNMVLVLNLIHFFQFQILIGVKKLLFLE